MFSFIQKAFIIVMAMVGIAAAAPLANRGSNTGEATYYNPEVGACGIKNTDSDFITAVSAKYFDTFPGYAGVNPNSNPLCGKTIRANYEGRTVDVKVTDRCVGCAVDDLDMTPAAFSKLADLRNGRIRGVTWDLLTS